MFHTLPHQHLHQSTSKMNGKYFTIPSPVLLLRGFFVSDSAELPLTPLGMLPLILWQQDYNRTKARLKQHSRRRPPPYPAASLLTWASRTHFPLTVRWLPRNYNGSETLLPSVHSQIWQYCPLWWRNRHSILTFHVRGRTGWLAHKPTDETSTLRAPPLPEMGAHVLMILAILDEHSSRWGCGQTSRIGHLPGLKRKKGRERERERERACRPLYRTGTSSTTSSSN